MNDKFVLRPSQPTDTHAIFELIKALAEYEKLSHAVVGSVEALQKHLFGSRPYAEAIVAESDGKAVGFALYSYNYSTFLTKPGIYLEDLFVLPEYRRQGIGKAIFKYLAELAVERDCGRMEWSVLDWNKPAIAFYHQIGAEILADWRICRITF
ncbi:GNAT family N-acetyltransferase [Chroococcidiopsis sp.]|uniref:GNAT family N-acetyltransferase n=1 Tax=Chroococcidiopsis sp. TaxID=3088168 RepID=UPI003F411EA1